MNKVACTECYTTWPPYSQQFKYFPYISVKPIQDKVRDKKVGEPDAEELKSRIINTGSWLIPKPELCHCKHVFVLLEWAPSNMAVQKKPWIFNALFISSQHWASSSISTCPTRADQWPTAETPGFANLHAKYAQPGLHVCQLTLSFVSDREITCTLDKTNVCRNPNKIAVTKPSRWSLPKKISKPERGRCSETKGNYATLWQLSVCAEFLLDGKKVSLSKFITCGIWKKSLVHTWRFFI